MPCPLKVKTTKVESKLDGIGCIRNGFYSASIIPMTVDDGALPTAQEETGFEYLPLFVGDI
jgi:hypothetical protein